jgi:DNA mismatch endonuclease (patch repair protein)
VVDNISLEQRSRVMASVRSKNTGPEFMARSLLHRMGFRFRLHRRDLPGSPDLCLPKYRTVIFVHGCFWHGHTCSHGSKRPSTNKEYWNQKLEVNIRRDAAAISALRAQGWKSFVIWECQLRSPKLADRVRKFLVSRRSPKP